MKRSQRLIKTNHDNTCRKIRKQDRLMREMQESFKAIADAFRSAESELQDIVTFIETEYEPDRVNPDDDDWYRGFDSAIKAVIRDLNLKRHRD